MVTYSQKELIFVPVCKESRVKVLFVIRPGNGDICIVDSMERPVTPRNIKVYDCLVQFVVKKEGYRNVTEGKAS
jgi:hypothetical protein